MPCRAMPCHAMRDEFEDGKCATVHQCRDMIVFGVFGADLVPCPATSQARSSKSANDVIYKR
jgi:hypothetical protein